MAYGPYAPVTLRGNMGDEDGALGDSRRTEANRATCLSTYRLDKVRLVLGVEDSDPGEAFELLGQLRAALERLALRDREDDGGVAADHILVVGLVKHQDLCTKEQQQGCCYCQSARHQGGRACQTVLHCGGGDHLA